MILATLRDTPSPAVLATTTSISGGGIIRSVPAVVVPAVEEGDAVVLFNFGDSNSDTGARGGGDGDPPSRTASAWKDRGEGLGTSGCRRCAKACAGVQSRCKATAERVLSSFCRVDTPEFG